MPEAVSVTDPCHDIFQSRFSAVENGVSGPSLDTSRISVDRTPDHDYITIGCTKCGTLHRVELECGDRLCKICAKKRQKRYRRYLGEKYATMEDSRRKKLSFLTLTLTSSSNLVEMIDFLFGSFRRLRSRKWWPTFFSMGVYSLEITKTIEGWHAHFHIMGVMNYKNQKVLTDEWRTATEGRGFIVDIRRVRGGYKSFCEIAKYPFKPLDMDRWGERDRENFRKAVRKRRLFGPLGEWHGDKVKKCDSRCSKCGSADTVVIEFSGITPSEFTKWYGDPG